MRILGMLALVLGSAVAASAQTNAPETRKLALADCIEIALHHNFDVQVTRYDPELDRYALLGSYGAYDPAFTFSGQHSFNRSPGGVDPQGREFGGTETEADSVSAGFSGYLPW